MHPLRFKQNASESNGITWVVPLLRHRHRQVFVACFQVLFVLGRGDKKTYFPRTSQQKSLGPFTICNGTEVESEAREIERSGW